MTNLVAFYTNVYFNIILQLKPKSRIVPSRFSTYVAQCELSFRTVLSHV
jgi:hypothetical protein